MELAPEITIRAIDLHLADRILLECLEATDQEGGFFEEVVCGQPWREAYGCVDEKLRPWSLSPHIRELVTVVCELYNEDVQRCGVWVTEYLGEADARELHGASSCRGPLSYDQHDIDKSSRIFSLCVGAPRIFCYREKRGLQWRQIMTTHGMLIEMSPRFQKYYEHEVPSPNEEDFLRYVKEHKDIGRIKNPGQHRYDITVRPRCMSCEATGREACGAPPRNIHDVPMSRGKKKRRRNFSLPPKDEQ